MSKITNARLGRLLEEADCVKDLSKNDYDRYVPLSPEEVVALLKRLKLAEDIVRAAEGFELDLCMEMKSAFAAYRAVTEE